MASENLSNREILFLPFYHHKIFIIFLIFKIIPTHSKDLLQMKIGTSFTIT